MGELEEIYGGYASDADPFYVEPGDDLTSASKLVQVIPGRLLKEGGEKSIVDMARQSLEKRGKRTVTSKPRVPKYGSAPETKAAHSFDIYSPSDGTDIDQLLHAGETAHIAKMMTNRSDGGTILPTKYADWLRSQSLGPKTRRNVEEDIAGEAAKLRSQGAGIPLREQFGNLRDDFARPILESGSTDAPGRNAIAADALLLKQKDLGGADMPLEFRVAEIERMLATGELTYNQALALLTRLSGEYRFPSEAALGELRKVVNAQKTRYMPTMTTVDPQMQVPYWMPDYERYIQDIGTDIIPYRAKLYKHSQIMGHNPEFGGPLNIDPRVVYGKHEHMPGSALIAKMDDGYYKVPTMEELYYGRMGSALANAMQDIGYRMAHNARKPEAGWGYLDEESDLIMPLEAFYGHPYPYVRGTKVAMDPAADYSNLIKRPEDK